MKKTIRRMLDQYPGVKAEFVSGGKHPRVIMHYQGRSRFMPYTSTPTDFRGERDKLKQIQKELQNLGVPV